MTPAQLLDAAERAELDAHWAAALADLDPYQLQVRDRVRLAVLSEQLAAVSEARAIRTLAAVPQVPCPVPDERSHRATLAAQKRICPGGTRCPHHAEDHDLAVGLRVSPTTVTGRRRFAARATSVLAPILDQLAAGNTTGHHLRSIDNTLAEVSDATASQVARDVVHAVDRDVSAFGQCVRYHLQRRMSPVEAATRNARAKKRKTGIDSYPPDLDGLARLGITGPLEQIEVLKHILKTHPDIRAAATDPEERRTAGQIRVDWLLGVCMADYRSAHHRPMPIPTGDPIDDSDTETDTDGDTAGRPAGSDDAEVTDEVADTAAGDVTDEDDADARVEIHVERHHPGGPRPSVTVGGTRIDPLTGEVLHDSRSQAARSGEPDDPEHADPDPDETIVIIDGVPVDPLTAHIHWRDQPADPPPTTTATEAAAATATAGHSAGEPEDRSVRRRSLARGACHTCGHAPGDVDLGVIVTASAETLTGLSNTPGTVNGEAVHAEIVRALMLHAGTLRGAIIDGNGIVRDLGRKHRLASRVQKTAISLKAPRCIFPNCRRRAATCELDHHLPWNQGGRTDLDNLWPLCKQHHRLKDLPGWTLTANPDGTMTWRTPTGYTGTTLPYDHRPETSEHDRDGADLGYLTQGDYEAYCAYLRDHGEYPDNWLLPETG